MIMKFKPFDHKSCVEDGRQIDYHFLNEFGVH